MRLRDYREFGSAGTWAIAGSPRPVPHLRVLRDKGFATVLAIGTRRLYTVDPDAETGTWGMGTGWEMGLIALDIFLRGEMPGGYAAETFEARPEIAQLADRCGQAWAAAVEAASTA